jgi:beta-glucosidase
MWPRVLPDGIGSVNEKGMDFYDQLVDELLGAGITPWVTLFHWDYPLALFYCGGWLNAESPQWFETYTRAVVERLSDRVHHWFTLNEPACFIAFGHRSGMQAPGLQLPDKEVCRVWHHAMLAHGRAVRAIRQESVHPSPQVGYAPVFRTTIPHTERPADIEAARTWMFSHEGGNLFDTRWNLDPCFRGVYPTEMMAHWGDDAPRIQDGDMELIRQDLDFLGLNIYHSARIRAGADGAPEVVDYPADYPRNSLGWPITPEALRWATRFLYEEYGKPLIITENGITLDEAPDEQGVVSDPRRVAFLNDYLTGLQRSVDDGIPVLGYFHWSIFDNFEWAEGYVPRFGLIHVDYATQRRTVKASGRWYGELIQQNAG